MRYLENIDSSGQRRIEVDKSKDGAVLEWLSNFPRARSDPFVRTKRPFRGGSCFFLSFLAPSLVPASSFVSFLSSISSFTLASPFASTAHDLHRRRQPTTFSLCPSLPLSHNARTLTMPILRSIPLLLTLKKPTLDLQGFSQKQEQHNPRHEELGQVIDLSVATSQVPLGEYPLELLQVRVKTLQEHLTSHFPSTWFYVASLVTVLVFLVAFVITLLALHVSDGKLWVLGVIAVMILTFVCKMSFLARMEKVRVLSLSPPSSHLTYPDSKVTDHASTLHWLIM